MLHYPRVLSMGPHSLSVSSSSPSSGHDLTNLSWTRIKKGVHNCIFSPYLLPTITETSLNRRYDLGFHHSLGTLKKDSFSQPLRASKIPFEGAILPGSCRRRSIVATTADDGGRGGRIVGPDSLDWMGGRAHYYHALLTAFA